MNHEERKAAADRNANPLVWVVYILGLEGGDYYIGSTGALAPRLMEHVQGEGAKVTAGRSFQVVMATPCLTRQAAEYNEKRLQEALAKSPRNIDLLTQVGAQLSLMIRPEKTLEQLEEDSRARSAKIQGTFHCLTGSVGAGSILPWKAFKTACGLQGDTIGRLRVFGTHDIEQFLESAEPAPWRARATWGRDLCQDCLAAARQSQADAV